MIAFGPIPSRRLGQSLGINNIPPKTCTYECVYCQVGPTTEKTLERRAFFPPEEVMEAVETKVAQSRAAGVRIDYLTIVPDGEPTLDSNLEELIRRLRRLEIPVAVITNGTLLGRPAVRAALAEADLVSVKVDAVWEDRWRRINRPADDLTLPAVLEGIRDFARGFSGDLITETMLVRGVNDDEMHLQAVADFLRDLPLRTAYIGIATRPPFETWVEAPDEATITMAYQLFADRLPEVECLTGFSPKEFSVSGDVITDLLAITAVHPMRESEVLSLLERGGAVADDLERLIRDDQLVRVEHHGQAFYIRKIVREAPAG